VERDPKPHQLHQPRRQCPAGLQRGLQGTECTCDIRTMPEYRCYPEIDSVALTEIVRRHRGESR
jgi:hypothetical protein